MYIFFFYMQQWFWRMRTTCKMLIKTRPSAYDVDPGMFLWMFPPYTSMIKVKVWARSVTWTFTEWENPDFWGMAWSEVASRRGCRFNPEPGTSVWSLLVLLCSHITVFVLSTFSSFLQHSRNMHVRWILKKMCEMFVFLWDPVMKCQRTFPHWHLRQSPTNIGAGEVGREDGWMGDKGITSKSKTHKLHSG